MATQPKPTPKKAAFLAAFAETGNLSVSAAAAKVHRSMHYAWLAKDPDYREAFEQARETAADRLEQEARRRAIEGTERPVYQGGKLVGTVREYSDTLLIFLLKGVRPDVYRDNVSVRHAGPSGGPIEVKHDADQERYQGLVGELLELLAASGGGASGNGDARAAGAPEPVHPGPPDS